MERRGGGGPGDEDVLLQLVEAVAGAPVDQQVADLDDRPAEEGGLDGHVELDRPTGQVLERLRQRTALALNLGPWRARLALADKGIAAVRYVRSRPVLIVGAALLLAALRPRRVGTWLQRGWLAWQIRRKLFGR